MFSNLFKFAAGNMVPNSVYSYSSRSRYVTSHQLENNVRSSLTFAFAIGMSISFSNFSFKEHRATFHNFIFFSALAIKKCLLLFASVEFYTLPSFLQKSQYLNSKDYLHRSLLYVITSPLVTALYTS